MQGRIANWPLDRLHHAAEKLTEGGEEPGWSWWWAAPIFRPAIAPKPAGDEAGPPPAGMPAAVPKVGIGPTTPGLEAGSRKWVGIRAPDLPPPLPPPLPQPPGMAAPSWSALLLTRSAFAQLLPPPPPVPPPPPPPPRPPPPPPMSQRVPSLCCPSSSFESSINPRRVAWLPLANELSESAEPPEFMPGSQSKAPAPPPPE